MDNMKSEKVVDLYVNLENEGTIGVIELKAGYREKYPTLAALRPLILEEVKEDLSGGFYFLRKGSEVDPASEKKRSISYCLSKTGSEGELLVKIRREETEENLTISSKTTGEELSNSRKHSQHSKHHRKQRKGRRETHHKHVVKGPMYIHTESGEFKKRFCRVEEKYYLCSYGYQKEPQEDDLGPCLGRIDLRFAKELRPLKKPISGQPKRYYVIELLLRKRDPRFDRDNYIIAVKKLEEFTTWMQLFHRVCRFPALKYEIDPDTCTWEKPQPHDQSEKDSSIEEPQQDDTKEWTKDSKPATLGLPPGMFNIHTVVFENGPLGMSVGNYGKTAAIDRIVHGGQAARGNVGIGDVVLRIGNQDVQGLPWEKVLDLLVTLPRPIEIVFGKKPTVAAGIPRDQRSPSVNQGPPVMNTGYNSYTVIESRADRRNSNSSAVSGMSGFSGVSYSSTTSGYRKRFDMFKRNQNGGLSVNQLKQQHKEESKGKNRFTKALFKFKQGTKAFDDNSSVFSSASKVKQKARPVGDLVNSFFGGGSVTSNPKKQYSGGTLSSGSSTSEFTNSGGSRTKLLQLKPPVSGGQQVLPSDVTTEFHEKKSSIAFSYDEAKQKHKTGAESRKKSAVQNDDYKDELSVSNNSNGTMTLEEVLNAKDSLEQEKLESYLSEEAFQDVFKMPRSVFENLPQFKREQKKRTAGLA